MSGMVANWLAALTAGATLVGLGQSIAGAVLVRRFCRRRPAESTELPAVTVLKPLYGDEPLLEEALASACVQDYPTWQVVFGVQRADDPAAAVVRRLQRRFPDRDLTLVIDAAYHGPNRKVGNLINMLAEVRHDVLVIADSDVHAAPDYLRRLVGALLQPGVGLVTTLYTGLPAHRGLPSVLGASGITHGFLPGALLARAMGRQDCLGATMCLRRDTLDAIGGFQALVTHLADDNVLGRKVRRLGQSVALADTVPATTVPEATLGALFRHELRWARTIAALEPAAFLASVLQYSLVWALLSVVLAAGAAWAVGLFLVAWAIRAAIASIIDRVLEGRGFAPAPHQEALPPGPPQRGTAPLIPTRGIAF
ncbi:MAG: bacteriohopanetetrol glucosamine biosynthesis glycosyltransferase HpnI, partial [Acetobacteraceae bacterium]